MSATNSISESELTDHLVAAALAAGRIILDVRDSADMTVDHKGDDSPVTIADRRAEAYILTQLATRAPGLPVVAEEAVEAGRVPDTNGAFFLVDPLDGTKEFIRGGEDFTVNIALVRDRAPVLGVVYAPAKQRLYVGAGDHARAADVDCRAGSEPVFETIAVRAPGERLAAVASRSHRTEETNDFLDRLRVAEADIVSAGSSLKFCLVAEGRADVYPRLGRTMEWDTAAGHAVLASAGGFVATVDGAPLLYNKRNQDDADFANPHFIAWGAPSPFGPGGS